MRRPRILAMSTLVLGLALGGNASTAQASPTLVDTIPGVGNSFVRIFGEERKADRLTVTVKPRSVTVTGKARIDLRKDTTCRRTSARSVTCPATSPKRLVLFTPLYGGNDSLTLKGVGPKRRVEMRFIGAAGNDVLDARIPIRAVRESDICAAGLGGNDRISVPYVAPPALRCDVEGGSGNDVLQGSNVLGGPGNDTITGTTGPDQIFGGSGDDAISGGAGRDALNGEDGRDKLTGGDGDDGLFGDGGDDTLDGEAGNDELYGGGGRDVLTGGLGMDLFFDTAGEDTRVDFDPAVDKDGSAAGE